MCDTDSEEYETVAPGHVEALQDSDPYVIEDVAYSPLIAIYVHNHPDDRRVYCMACPWETTVGELPEDSGTIQPDVCPQCAKESAIGPVRTESRDEAERRGRR